MYNLCSRRTFIQEVHILGSCHALHASKQCTYLQRCFVVLAGPRDGAPLLPPHGWRRGPVVPASPGSPRVGALPGVGAEQHRHVGGADTGTAGPAAPARPRRPFAEHIQLHLRGEFGRQALFCVMSSDLTSMS